MDTTPPHGSALVFEGQLYKQSKWLKSWRLRYFKLYSTPSGPRLYFSNDESAPPHGIIELNNCLTVKSADDKTGKPNSFEVATASDVFFMHAVDGRHDGREKTASALKDEVSYTASARGWCTRFTPATPPTPHHTTNSFAVGRRDWEGDRNDEQKLSNASRR